MFHILTSCPCLSLSLIRHAAFTHAISSIVVGPANGALGGLLEDVGQIFNARGKEAVVVLTMTVGGTRNGGETVGVGGLYLC